MADGGDAGDEGADGAADAGQAAEGTGTGATDTGAAEAQQDASKKGADLWEDPAKAKAEIERLRAENGKDRTTAKTKAAEDARNELTQTLGKALGLIKDEGEKPDPAKLTQQITETAAAAKQAQTELAVYKAAGKAGADADALLDSRAFLAKIADLDPSKTADIEKAIKEAVTSNPKLKTVQVAGASGADFSGGSGESAKQPTSLEDAIARKMAR
jgi:hypothetical protein